MHINHDTRGLDNISSVRLGLYQPPSLISGNKKAPKRIKTCTEVTCKISGIKSLHLIDRLLFCVHVSTERNDQTEQEERREIKQRLNRKVRDLNRPLFSCQPGKKLSYLLHKHQRLLIESINQADQFICVFIHKALHFYHQPEPNAHDFVFGVRLNDDKKKSRTFPIC